MLRLFRIGLFVPAAFLLLDSNLAAQIKLGETSTSGDGTISSGYSATYGNMTQSTHGWTVGGAATFAGSFHSPNFISYNFSPYLNQSRANSNFQSISNASGFNLSANIFAGSKFPGSLNYSKAYNSEGNYAVPGLANYVTHGDSDTFGVNWSENLPDAPSFSAGFQMGSSQYSVYGTNDTGHNAFHSLNLHSGYKWAGFNWGAYYVNGITHSEVPQLSLGTLLNVQSSNNGYGVNAMHLIPFHGSVSAGWNRSEWETGFPGFKSNGTIDTVNANAGIHPFERLSLTATANYSDNLAGQIIQSVVSAGGVAPGLNSNESSNSLDLMAVSTYAPLPNLQTSAFFERRTQEFLGQQYGVKSYGGGAAYTHALLNGTFNSSGTVTANSSEQNGQDTIGLSATVNYSNVVSGWHLNESFSYAQNVQTLLVTYMNSFYNYSVNARRNWGRFNVSLGAGGAQTALTEQAGTSNSSQNYEAAVGFGAVITANGSYSRADGQALLTGSGLVVVPVPSPVLPSNVVSLFGGESYSFGLSSTPVRKLMLSASYAKATSNTTSYNVVSANDSSEFNSIIQYQVRKLNFISGYSRLQQGFSASQTGPQIVSSYYMGISRWFKLF